LITPNASRAQPVRASAPKAACFPPANKCSKAKSFMSMIWIIAKAAGSAPRSARLSVFQWRQNAISATGAGNASRSVPFTQKAIKCKSDIDFYMTNYVKDFLYEEESYAIGEACNNVYKQFKGAFREKVVDRALTIALKELGLTVEEKKVIPVYYKNEKVGTYIPDKIINGKIILELKCKPFLVYADRVQSKAYINSTDYKLLLLINFAPIKLEIVRIIYDRARTDPDGVFGAVGN
jgi:GxxExxY protein